jgi:hypothetical protein
MNPGFCYLAEHSQLERVFTRVNLTLRNFGLVLAHPGSGFIRELVGDGDSVSIDEAELRRATKNRKELTPQFWLSPDTYVASQLRALPGDTVRHSYSLDGLTAEQRKRIVLWAIDYFERGIRERTALLLVVDPSGRTADTDWDEIATHRAALPDVLPSILGLPSDWLNGSISLAAYDRSRVDGYELIVEKQP